MTDYDRGSLFQSFGGKQIKTTLNTSLDALFKNSAGPAKLPVVITQPASSGQSTTDAKSSKSKPGNEGVAALKKNGGEKPTAKRKQKVEIEDQYESMKKLQQAVKKATKANVTVTRTLDKKRKKDEEEAMPVKRKKISPNTDEVVSQKSLGRKASKREKDDEEEQDTGSEQDEDSEEESETKSENYVPPLHESLAKSKTDDKERLERTVFVGNLPVSTIGKADYKKLKTEFAKYGKIESIRFRSVAFSDLLPRKIAFITGKLHAERDIVNAYIVYMNTAMAQKALEMNTKVFLGKHLRVDGAANPKNHDRKRSVFVGNIAFDAHEEALWTFFKDCGDIENVRIVRDPKTNLGKGFAYVQFMNRESVDFALQLHETKLEKRKLRVQRCLLSRNEADNPESGRTGVRDRANKGATSRHLKGDQKPFRKRQHNATLMPKAFEGVRASKGGETKVKKAKKTKAPRIRTRTQAFKLGHVKGKANSKNKDV